MHDNAPFLAKLFHYVQLKVVCGEIENILMLIKLSVVYEENEFNVDCFGIQSCFILTDGDLTDSNLCIYHDPSTFQEPKF